jgi:hypothetical protein
MQLTKSQLLKIQQYALDHVLAGHGCVPSDQGGTDEILDDVADVLGWVTQQDNFDRMIAALPLSREQREEINDENIGLFTLRGEIGFAAGCAVGRLLATGIPSAPRKAGAR